MLVLKGLNNWIEGAVSLKSSGRLVGKSRPWYRVWTSSWCRWWSKTQKIQETWSQYPPKKTLNISAYSPCVSNLAAKRPNMVSIGSRDNQRCPQDSSRWHQDSTRWHQDSPNLAQDGLRIARDGHEMPSRWSKMSSRWLKMVHDAVQIAQESSQKTCPGYYTQFCIASKPSVYM